MKQLASTRLAPLKHDLKSGVGIGRGGQSKDNKVGSSVLVSADVFVVFLELPLWYSVNYDMCLKYVYIIIELLNLIDL